jgi:glucuronate isomerase
VEGFEKELWAELETTPVLDPHTHLTPDHPQAANLADLVLYHHVWIELVSAGMPVTAATHAGLPHELADPGMAPLDRVRAALPYLPAIRSTTCCNLLRVLLEDLYDVPHGELTEANLEDISLAVEQKARTASWPAQVLRDRCHMATSLTVAAATRHTCSTTARKHETPEVAARSAAMIEIGVERWLGLGSGKRTPAQTLADLERDLGCQVRTADDLGAALYNFGRDHSVPPTRFLGLWLPPCFGCDEVAASEVTAVIARARDGRRLESADVSLFTCHAARGLLSGLLEGSVRTVQVIVGADVLAPHRSLTQWGPEFVTGLGRLAGEFPDLRFNCSTASDLHTQDLAVLAKHVPNVSVAGYWWHTLYPFYLRKSVETRLDMVPANKIVGFFSDAYHAEWCYPKLQLVKRVWGEVLTDRVNRGLLRAETALSLVRPIFCDNAKRIYGLD